MIYINFIDTKITNFINAVLPYTLLLNYFFSFFSLRGSSILIWLIVIAIVLILEERKNPGIQKRDLKFILIFLLTFTLSYVTSDVILKNLIKRHRPTYPKALLPTDSVGGSLAQCPKDYSFPSTHATTAFASATILTAFDKKRRWFYYFIAILIALSRIFLGCHYFFDVVFGAIIGWLISVSIVYLSNLKGYKI